MPFFREGDHPQTGIPNAPCYPFTFGYRLGNGRVTPCTVQGQAAEFAFGPHGAEKAVDVDGQGRGVSLHSHKHSGGTGVPVLAGGAIAPGAEIIVGMVEFTNNDDKDVTLPVALSVNDAEVGDMIVGKYVGQGTISGADTSINRPSVAWESYDIPRRVAGTESVVQTISFDVDLPSMDANGDVPITWTPTFAGTFLSDYALVTDAATTAAKAATLTPRINGTNITGGVLALTSANMTPEGAVVEGSAVTAANVFDANDVITFIVSGLTAFVEGKISVYVRFRTATAQA